MAMTADELAEYRQASDAQQRAIRRRIIANLDARNASSWYSPWPPEPIDTRPKPQPIHAPCSRASILAGARADLEAFQRGDDPLFGMPRAAVNFDKAYEALS